LGLFIFIGSSIADTQHIFFACFCIKRRVLYKLK
jgi:hypothetical protein